MEVVLLVLFGGAEAAALLGDHVHQDRAAEPLGLLERVDKHVDVVAVDRAEVLQPEVAEQHLRGQHVLQSTLHAVQQVVGLASQRPPLHRVLHRIQSLLVARVGADRRQMARQTTHGRGVGASVVVYHDDQRQVIVDSDVVQGFPSHATSQRTVTDHHRHGALVLAAQLETACHALCPAQPGGGVRVLHPVVFRLGPGRVAGQAVGLPQGHEVVATAGEDLVDIALVAGVEDDRVVRGVEDPVERDGQLDYAEVWAEVPPSSAHLRDQELPDLSGQLGQLLAPELSQVIRFVDRLQQRHTLTLPGVGSIRRCGAAGTGGWDDAQRLAARDGNSTTADCQSFLASA